MMRLSGGQQHQSQKAADSAGGAGAGEGVSELTLPCRWPWVQDDVPMDSRYQKERRGPAPAQDT